MSPKDPDFLPGDATCRPSGRPGTGKTHIAKAVGCKAIKQRKAGDRRSIFDVVRDFLHLETMNQDDTVPADDLEPHPPIIEDTSPKGLPSPIGESHFGIVLRRHQTRSTIITSNGPIDDRDTLLDVVPCASAFLDRFLHHAEIMSIHGRSCRLHTVQPTAAAALPTRRPAQTERTDPTPPRTEVRRRGFFHPVPPPRWPVFQHRCVSDFEAQNGMDRRGPAVPSHFRRAIGVPPLSDGIGAPHHRHLDEHTMIITDSYVFVHLPKTGGTFVAATLRQAHGIADPKHEPRGVWHSVLGTRRRGLLELNKHGTCRDIPRRHAAKRVVATTRSPYDRYVSQYEYGWWRKYPKSMGEPSVLRRLSPSFPDIGFEEYVRLADALHTLQPAPGARPVGPFARAFVNFFSSDPRAFFEQLAVSSSTTEAWSRHCKPDRFLRFERLNEDLHRWLSERGYPADRIAFVPSAGKVYPQGGGREGKRHWSQYYSAQLKDFVRTREWLLFDLFPEYDV